MLLFIYNFIALKMICFVRSINPDLPHCFLVNVLQSFVSQSNTVSTLNSKVTLGANILYIKVSQYQGKRCDLIVTK